MMLFIERFTLNRAWSDLGEEEFFWEPAPNCWSVRRRDECCTPNPFGTGDWVADFDGSVIRAAMEGKGVEPLTDYRLVVLARWIHGRTCGGPGLTRWHQVS